MDALQAKLRGVLTWSTVDRVGQQSVQFLIGIVLARLLQPSDYGLLGMVMIFAQFAYVMVESGFGWALVRTKNLSDLHCNTVFYTNLGISLLTYLGLFFCAPLIANFFAQPQLVSIARVTFLAVLFNALYLVQFNLLGRKLDYKTVTKINVISTVCSGVAGIVMAYTGWGVWALVVQQTGYHFVRMLCFWFWRSWVPRWQFSRQVLRDYLPFSVHILGTSLLNVAFNNLYTLLLGKTYPIRQVGLYTQAYKMSETVNFTFLSILGASYNVFAQIHDQWEEITRMLRQLNHRCALVNIPVCAFLMACAPALFYVLFGEKWMESVPYFVLLCAANLFSPLYQVNNHALNALGLSKVTFRIELLKKACILLSVFVCLVGHWNVMRMLEGYVISCYIAYAYSMFAIKQHLRYYYRHQIRDALPGLVVGLLLSAVCLGLRYTPLPNPYLLLLTQAVVTLLLYAGYIRLFHRPLWDETLQWIHQSTRA